MSGNYEYSVSSDGWMSMSAMKRKKVEPPAPKISKIRYSSLKVHRIPPRKKFKQSSMLHYVRDSGSKKFKRKSENGSSSRVELNTESCYDENNVKLKEGRLNNCQYESCSNENKCQRNPKTNKLRNLQNANPEAAGSGSNQFKLVRRVVSNPDKPVLTREIKETPSSPLSCCTNLTAKLPPQEKHLQVYSGSSKIALSPQKCNRSHEKRIETYPQSSKIALSPQKRNGTHEKHVELYSQSSNIVLSPQKRNKPSHNKPLQNKPQLKEPDTLKNTDDVSSQNFSLSNNDKENSPDLDYDLTMKFVEDSEGQLIFDRMTQKHGNNVTDTLRDSMYFAFEHGLKNKPTNQSTQMYNG
ncbi:uncharacterized protein LOC144743413 [Ciona intestinalis]